MENKKQNKIWMVRSGSGGYLIEDFLKDGIIAIGWNETGAIKKGISVLDLKKLLLSTYQNWSSGKLGQTAGQIWRFINEFNIGDKVVTYDSSSRGYYLGEITSDYYFNADYEYNHYRKVKWNEDFYPRDFLSTETKNILGSILTIFELDIEIFNEIQSSIPDPLTEEEQKDIEDAIRQHDEEQKLIQLKDDITSRSREFIKDIVSNLTWQDTEKLVAGLLRTMGYKTRMTSKGSDLGSDIIASPDELGLEEPRIKVEVKKRTDSKISAPEIRNFIGGLREHHKGIYVTTSGFTKEAKYESERANFAITLIDSDWLVELIVSNYEALDVESKALIPLRKIYWPV